MTRARYQQVSLADTPYYHCISRCVRRAYLCGQDPVTGQNFDHRKPWLVNRIKELAAYFAVDVCAYAVMSNHYHLVLFVNAGAAEEWTDEEVIRRWTLLFPRNASLVETLYKNRSSKTAKNQLARTVALWRDRLMDISWFMRCLNESIARKANKEDDCSGRFWEGRFKSQALLDEKALVSCMAYVDLNPVRAGISDSLETSDFTSIQERLIQHAKQVKNKTYRQHRLLTRRSSKHLVGRKRFPQVRLHPLGTMSGVDRAALPLSPTAYFDLLENTVKALHADADDLPRQLEVLQEKQEILPSLGLSAGSWLMGVREFHKHCYTAAGSSSSLVDFHRSRIKAGADFKHPHKWIRGIHSAEILFGT